MKAIKPVICEGCGARIIPGNRASGIPNGIGFGLGNGYIVNMCADCLMDKKTVERICDKYGKGKKE